MLMPLNRLSGMLLTDSEKALILIELGKLAVIRNEDVEDYCFELWLETLEPKYTLPEIIEMIISARDLKKYGDIKLSCGDVIDNYEKNKKETPVSWVQFLKMLSIYEKKAFEDIQKLAGGKHISLEDYFKHRQYLENRFEEVYGIKN